MLLQTMLEMEHSEVTVLPYINIHFGFLIDRIDILSKYKQPHIPTLTKKMLKHRLLFGFHRASCGKLSNFATD